MTDRWGDAEFTGQLARMQWMASPVVQLHLNERATGSPARDWLTAWAPRFFPEGPLRVLVLGCGEGWLERALACHSEPRRGRGIPRAKTQSIVHIDAIDAAADAVARARDQADREGINNITYRVADLNLERLERGAYDVIIAHSVLHHVERLEHAFAEIEAALKTHGTFLINEYAGPRRFQYSDRVHEIINALLRAIPVRFRGNRNEKGRATEAEIAAEDPSEAVRSDELIAMTAARFAVVDRVDLGGTVLQHLLYELVPNFAFEDPLARSIVELLCIFEGALIDARVIPSDYVLIAGHKRDAPPLAPRKVALPALPAEAAVTIRDPLGFGPKRRAPHPPPSLRSGGPLSPLTRGEGSSQVPAWMLRTLRVALLARTPDRPILNPDSTLHRAIERLRFALRRDRSESAFDYLLARLPADSEVLPLLEVMGRIAG